MATFVRFEDIESWKKARVLASDLYRVTSVGLLSRDFGLSDQLRRAGVSVMANIAEGFGCGGNREFGQFLAIAHGSCSEVKSHLYLSTDAGLLTAEDFERLFKLASEAEALISGLMKYLQRSDIKGRKYPPIIN